MGLHGQVGTEKHQQSTKRHGTAWANDIQTWTRVPICAGQIAHTLRVHNLHLPRHDGIMDGTMDKGILALLLVIQALGKHMLMQEVCHHIRHEVMKAPP